MKKQNNTVATIIMNLIIIYVITMAMPILFIVVFSTGWGIWSFLAATQTYTTTQIIECILFGLLFIVALVGIVKCLIIGLKKIIETMKIFISLLKGDKNDEKETTNKL